MAGGPARNENEHSSVVTSMGAFQHAARTGLRKISDLGSNAWGGRSGSADVIDHVADLAKPAEGDGDHVVEADVWVGGNFDGAGKHDVGMPENAIDAETPGFVAGDGICDFVG